MGRVRKKHEAHVFSQSGKSVVCGFEAEHLPLDLQQDIAMDEGGDPKNLALIPSPSFALDPAVILEQNEETARLGYIQLCPSFWNIPDTQDILVNGELLDKFLAECPIDHDVPSLAAGVPINLYGLRKIVNPNSQEHMPVYGVRRGNSLSRSRRFGIHEM